VVTRHVEIAGAGLGGLTAAAALAQSGWSVRVHERSPELREIGAGVYLWENATKALDWIGATDRVGEFAEPIKAPELWDHRDRVVQRDWMRDGRLYVARRTDLHRVLAEICREAGVEIVTNSRVVSASAYGTLMLEDGSERRGDLVIGADGVGSVVRKTLGLEKEVVPLPDGCGRHLITRTEDDPAHVSIEQWSGGRRIGVVPCAPDSMYIFLCCPSTDADGIRQSPFERDTWIKSFPAFESQISRIPSTSEGRYATFSDVHTTSWSLGKAAVLGDAAHAMSPNLGQAACMAMTNSVALAQALQNRSVSAGLQVWEESQRALTDRVQQVSRLYGLVGTAWPEQERLQDVRSSLIKLLVNTSPVQRTLQFAARTFPDLSGAAVVNGDSR
jgi:2-polyprenyl-6-methoxyphenol hydroxylase-like FAD-dependent oxidoreductase